MAEENKKFDDASELVEYSLLGERKSLSGNVRGVGSVYEKNLKDDLIVPYIRTNSSLYGFVTGSGRQGTLTRGWRMEKEDIYGLERILLELRDDLTDISITNSSGNEYEFDFPYSSLPKLESLEIIGFLPSEIDLSKNKEIKNVNVFFRSYGSDDQYPGSVKLSEERNPDKGRRVIIGHTSID